MSGDLENLVPTISLERLLSANKHSNLPFTPAFAWLFLVDYICPRCNKSPEVGSSWPPGDWICGRSRRSSEVGLGHGEVESTSTLEALMSLWTMPSLCKPRIPTPTM